MSRGQDLYHWDISLRGSERLQSDLARGHTFGRVTRGGDLGTAHAKEGAHSKQRAKKRKRKHVWRGLRISEGSSYVSDAAWLMKVRVRLFDPG